MYSKMRPASPRREVRVVDSSSQDAKSLHGAIQQSPRGYAAVDPVFARAAVVFVRTAAAVECASSLVWQAARTRISGITTRRLHMFGHRQHTAASTILDAPGTATPHESE